MNVDRPAGRRGNCRGAGQALAEFALVAPLFFLILFAIIEAGRFIYYYEVLNNATREGARYAIVNGSNSLTCPTGPPAPGTPSCDPTGDDVRDAVKKAAFGALGTGITVTPTWFVNNDRGNKVRVEAVYTYSALIPVLPNITVTAESSLVINN